MPSGRRRGEGVLKEKSLNRHSRGCSGSSSGSSTLQDTVRRASHRVPSRQPTHPPQGTLAQSNAGFAKFLKEHSSPKHQRVTAGGRIVPFELDTKVAPEFKLPAKSEEQSRGQRSPSNQSLKVTPNRKAKGQEKPGQQTGNFKPKPIPVVGLSPFDSTATAASHTGTNARPSSPGRQRSPPFPNPAAPLFQPSSEGNPIANSCSSIGNAIDQFGWGSAPCFSNMSQPPQPPILPGMYNFGIPTCTSPAATQSPSQMFQLPSAGAVLNNAVLGASAQPLLPQWASTQALEDATREFENISKELEDLDRYLAIRFQIDPTAKRILVEQRMELVEKKNAARAAKEWIEQTLEQNAKQGPVPNTVPDPQLLQPMPDAAAVYPQSIGSPPNTWIPGLMPSFTGSNGYPSPIPNPSLFLPPYQPLASPIPAMGGFSGQAPNQVSDKQFTFKAPETVDGQSAAATSHPAAEREKVWDKAPENAPPEIMRVYQNLEDAVKRGADLEPHLQELSRAIINLKHKRSVVQRQRTISREMNKDATNAKGGNTEMNVLTTAAVNEKTQSEALPKRASGTENNVKRRFRRKKEPRQNKKDSKKTAPTSSSSNDGTRSSGVDVESPTSNEAAKPCSSSSTYTNRGSSSATSEQMMSASTTSRLRYDAATFTPLKQQVESQLKSAEASAVESTVTAYWTPTTPGGEAVQRASRSTGDDPMKTKESSGGFFGWFRRALSPSPESQGSKGFVQNFRQNEREGRKSSHGGKHAHKVRAS
ncbi:hypothetical protein KEM56_002315 [Ascosphaera pollenicola]|nr:hypothetical protein KEM56_002315 [Ascosphaera pollenicola]